MKLSELFLQLTHGELKDVYIGGEELGTIQDSDYPILLSYVNRGLREIYTRLPLAFKEYNIDLHEAIYTYHLTKEYALTNTESTQRVKYIADSVFDPFTDNLIKVEQVYTEIGQECPINDVRHPFSVSTPTYNSLGVPFVDSENSIAVICRVGHPEILLTADFDPTLVTLDIPSWIEEALTIYVASRVVGNILSNDNATLATYYQSRFEKELSKVNELNLINTDLANTDHRLKDNGWV